MSQRGADSSVLTSDVKVRFPFPREVRFNLKGSFFELFSLLFFCIFSAPQKTSFFNIFLIFRFSNVDFSVFLAILGTPWQSFLVIFQDCIFWSFFCTFFDKKTKSEKSENCLKPCKTRTIVKVATFKKKGEERRKHDEKNIDFWWKIGPKSKQTSGKTALIIKCTKRACFEGALFVKRCFFNDFWAPARSQNELQNGPLDSKLGFGWPRKAPGSPQGQF